MSDDISVRDLERWRATHRDFVLLDVREPHELEIARFPDSVNIPLGQLPARIGELDTKQEIAVLCHLGGRSSYAASYLRAHGFKNVHNVDGGIDAYAEAIDPAMPRY